MTAARFALDTDDGEHIEVDGADMLRDNDGDDEVCDFVRSAKVGDIRIFGGGAAPTVRIERIAVRS